MALWKREKVIERICKRMVIMAGHGLSCVEVVLAFHYYNQSEGKRLILTHIFGYLQTKIGSYNDLTSGNVIFFPLLFLN